MTRTETVSTYQVMPNTELQSLAITDLTQEPREPVAKKQKQRQTQKGAARVVANEARASAGSSGSGADGQKKQRPQSSTALT